MAVGENEAVRRQDDAGTCSAAVLAVLSGIAATIAAMHGKPHHGRADPVDHIDHGARIGIEQRLVVGGDTGNVGRGSAFGVLEGIGKGHYCHVLSAL